MWIVVTYYGMGLMMALFKIEQGLISTMMNAAGFWCSTADGIAAGNRNLCRVLWIFLVHTLMAEP